MTLYPAARNNSKSIKYIDQTRSVSGFLFWKQVMIKSALVFLFVLVFSCFSQDIQLQSRFLFSFGEKGDQPGRLNHPQSVSCDLYGNIYIADTNNNRIQKFDFQGNLLSFIGGFGWEKEQFQIPLDIHVYNSLDVYVADYENSRIERYDKDLNWITSYYSNDNWEEKYQFEFPRAVFQSLHGDIFIVDSQNDRITKLNSSFEPELTFGDFDWGQGVLQNPLDICVSLQDIVYVSDSDAGKIRVYDYYGSFLYDIGAGVLTSPHGICTTPQGHLFVADPAQNKVFAFDQRGRLLVQIGSAGHKLGAFNEPYDVDVVRNKLVVADAANHRIQIFELDWMH